MSNVKMPQPSAYMDRQTGGPYEIRLSDHMIGEPVPNGAQFYTEQQMRTYARAVRDEALDEAAKMVDNCHPKASHKGIASAIRALKERS